MRPRKKYRNLYNKYKQKDYAAALDALLKQHTVVIVGGNENLMKKFQVAHPDASLVAKDMLGTCDQQIQNADIVMFKVDSCSHALYNKKERPFATAMTFRSATSRMWRLFPALSRACVSNWKRFLVDAPCELRRIVNVR